MSLFVSYFIIMKVQVPGFYYYEGPGSRVCLFLPRCGLSYVCLQAHWPLVCVPAGSLAGNVVMVEEQGREVREQVSQLEGLCRGALSQLQDALPRWVGQG